MKVYLSGGIGGLTFEEANKWRSEATEQLREFGIQVLNPLRGRMFEAEVIDNADFNPNELVHRDLRDMRQCDLVLARLDVPSIGTTMEIWHTYFVEHKPVILVSNNRNIQNHPWIQVACTKVFDKQDKAIEYIVTRWADEEQV